MVRMRARRTIALIVLTALVGGLGLPWLGDSHEFNDDPHWVVVGLEVEHGEGPSVDAGLPGDETHCEVCHWLRTMRTADRPAQAGLFASVLPVEPPVSVDPGTRNTSLRILGARAPPALT